MNTQDILIGTGLTQDQVKTLARETVFDGRPSPQHIQAPSRGKPDWKLEQGDLCLITKYCQAHDVIGIVLDFDIQRSVVVLYVENAPGDEIRLPRAGVQLLARAHQVDSWEPNGLIVNSWEEGISLATARLTDKDATVQFCIAVEKAGLL